MPDSNRTDSFKAINIVEGNRRHKENKMFPS